MSITSQRARSRGLDILISGASVAGPALAYWLRRHGFNPTIVERAPALREGGHAVDFRGDVHLGLLERMGLLDEVRRERTGMGAMAYVNEAGRKIATVPGDLFSGDVEILRGDLSRILYAATKGETEYLFGDSITSLTEDADGVLVTFERSAPRRFDLVVGADGLHSTVRALAFGPERDFVRPLGLHVAIFTVPDTIGLTGTGHLYSAPGRTVGMYGTRDGAAKAVFYFGSPAQPYDRHDEEAQKRLVADAYAGVGWRTPELLDRMWTAPDFYFDAIAQVRMARWSSGRVALVGDAATAPSPLSGMGTGLALVGAYVLAGELAAAGGDHRAAFPAYEEAVRGYAEGCVKSAEGVAGWMVPESRFMAWLMRQNYRLVPYLPWKGLIARSIRKTASAITLKSYDE